MGSPVSVTRLKIVCTKRVGEWPTMSRRCASKACQSQRRIQIRPSRFRTIRSYNSPDFAPAKTNFQKKRKILKVGKRSASRKARSVPLFDARRNPCRDGSQTQADRHLLAKPTRHVVVARRRKRSKGGRAGLPAVP